jgi:hypothetical protein
MNDFLLIFMGIFILLLIFLIFILLAYVYHTYTTYTVDINKNLETSEDAINNTSTAFNKLQDSVINELAKVNKNQETIITTLPDNLISLNSNLLNIFEISSNNNKITDITKTKIDYDSLGVLKPFTSYKNFTTITDATNNFLTICNNKTDPSKKACIRMNIDDSDMFNIYTSNINRNSSNVLGINIYDSNNGVLASFDAFNRKILLGSGSSETAAISINNNVYTPNIIVCKYSYTQATDNATQSQINTAIASVTGVRDSITSMLILLNTAIDTIANLSEKTSARTPYNIANAKNTLAAGNIINIQEALSALTLLNDSYTAAKNAADTATTATATGIGAVNSALTNIKTSIDTARTTIATASIVRSDPKITLNIISNIPINTSTFINLPIFDTFIITNSNSNQDQANNISYLQNILKFKPVANIAKNTIANIIINLNSLSVLPSPSTTTGYITTV